MRIGIIGNGVLGSTLHRWLREKFVDVAVYDANPERSLNTFDEVAAADWAFICINILDNCASLESRWSLLNLTRELSRVKTIVVRTTVVPGTTDFLRTRTGLTILFWPEFLVERAPWRSFSEPALQVVGAAREDLAVAYTLLRMAPAASCCARVVTPRQAEILKHALNACLATKVSFFNQLYDYFGDDLGPVVEALRHEPRVGATHMDQYQDGYRGWGGKCFTKDVPALAALTKGTILDAVVKYNDALIRKGEKG